MYCWYHFALEVKLLKKRAKMLLHFVLAAVIAGQALSAVAVPCSVATELPTATAAGEDPHHGHAGHAMATNDAAGFNAAQGVVTGDTAMNCCDGGYCSASGCFSVPAIASAGIEPPDAPYAAAPAATDNLFQSRARPSLFRPPTDR